MYGSSPFAMSKGEAAVGLDEILATPIKPETSGALSVSYRSGYKSPLPNEWIEVTGISDVALSRIFPGDSNIEPISVRTSLDESAGSMFGRSELDGDLLKFYPRFGLQAGIPYYVYLSGSHLSPANEPTIFSFLIPKEELKPETIVSAVYPSGNELPANLLKFYIHFSNPMSVGDVYSHIQILDTDNQALELPFLELGEELWDSESRRLTLLFDPGRIKRGLKPNRDVGAPLTQGETYTLQISDKLLDAKGRPLKTDFSKTFTVVPMDTVSPNPYNWKLSKPPAGSREPVVLTFPESIDEALLQRVVFIEDANGNELYGSVTISRQETVWSFHPDTAWRIGSYKVKAQTILEDTAGNSIARPFEVDVSRPSEGFPETKFVYLPFDLD